MLNIESFYLSNIFTTYLWNKNHNSEPYCYFVIKPKMDKLKKVFAGKLKQ